MKWRGKKVSRAWLALALCALLAVTVFASEEQGDNQGRERLTGDWMGARSALEDRGLSLDLGLTQVYQRNTHGGLAAGVGRWAGSYDLELGADMERMADLRGGEFYMLAEGAWTGGQGLDSRAVGSLFGINDDMGGERTMDVTELWYQQNFMDDALRFRLGKLDLTAGFESRGVPGAFDGNMFANDETSQFLNSALVNNPAVPFPDNGLGFGAYQEITSWWYVSGAVADAEANATEAGINTTFDGDTHLFYVVETGLVPSFESNKGELPGAYRLGVWNDRQPKEYLAENRTKRDDLGVYLSAGQMLWLENGEPEDEQGFGLFGRAGWADDKVNEIKVFGSLGAQYTGLIPGRDADVLALGLAEGRLSGHADFSSSYERTVELYYRAELAPWFQLSPSVQWISNPGGQSMSEDPIVIGCRAQLAF